MNNYCKKCRLRDGCLQKCKEAEIYEQGYNDAVEELKMKKKSVNIFIASLLNTISSVIINISI